MMRHLLPLMLIGATGLSPVAANATSLDATACELLQQEISALDKAGVRSNFDKGVGWAMANLKPEDLQQIEKLIDTEAQFNFRCPQPKRHFDAATEAVMENGTGSDPEGDAVKAAPAKKATKPTAATTATPNAPAAKPAAKPKRIVIYPKPVDAFVPKAGAAPAAGLVPQ